MMTNRSQLMSEKSVKKKNFKNPMQKKIMNFERENLKKNQLAKLKEFNNSRKISQNSKNGFVDSDLNSESNRNDSRKGSLKDASMHKSHYSPSKFKQSKVINISRIAYIKKKGKNLLKKAKKKIEGNSGKKSKNSNFEKIDTENFSLKKKSNKNTSSLVKNVMNKLKSSEMLIISPPKSKIGEKVPNLEIKKKEKKSAKTRKYRGLGPRMSIQCFSGRGRIDSSFTIPEIQSRNKSKDHSSFLAENRPGYNETVQSVYQNKNILDSALTTKKVIKNKRKSTLENLEKNFTNFANTRGIHKLIFFSSAKTSKNHHSAQNSQKGAKR